MTGRDVILRRTSTGYACECRCREDGGRRHVSCRGWINANDVIVELVDEHGIVARMCPACGELSTDWPRSRGADTESTEV